jgi:translation elongation factor EF-1alpha
MKKRALGTGMFSLKSILSSKYLTCSLFCRGEAFIPYIDQLPSLGRVCGGPFMMPVVDKYKDMGTVVMGKVESGEARKGQSLLLMPNRVRIKTTN